MNKFRRQVEPRRLVVLTTLAFLGTWCATDALAQSGLPSDAEIRQMLVDRIDVQHRTVGIVVGVLTPQGRRTIAYGHLEKGDSRPLDGDTIFEIGSVSKVFSSLLLSQMVQRGQMALNDPVAKYLPEDVRVPQKDGKQISLADLATHTSGLPRMPDNFSPRNQNDPFVDYSVPQLYAFLSGYTLTRDPGVQYEYSNVGAGLLGFAVAQRAGASFETLVQKRIADPLNMKSTTITLTPAMKQRLAVGHHVVGLQTMDNWGFGPALEAAGAIRSTANDLLKFLAANLDYTETPLAIAMHAMRDVRRPSGTPNLEIALGWHIFTADGKEIIWHNGATGGYRAFIGFDPGSRTGIVALSNTLSQEGVDDIGHHLLDEKFPLWVPPDEPKVAKIEPLTFDGYVGTYRLTPRASIAVTRQGDHLYAQKLGYAVEAQTIGHLKVELLPENQRQYFVHGLSMHVTFVTDGQGRGTEIIVREGLKETHAMRVQ